VASNGVTFIPKSVKQSTDTRVDMREQKAHMSTHKTRWSGKSTFFPYESKVCLKSPLAATESGLHAV
jgi:hypothetical protein